MILFAIRIHMRLFLFIILLLVGLYSTSIRAQEVRVQANTLILGCIDNPFFGVGAGVETGIGDHFGVSFDFNWGVQKDGTSVELRPSVNYYFEMDQLGFFVGGVLNMIILTKDDKNIPSDWASKFYTLGLNLGYKKLLSEKWTLGITIIPQYNPSEWCPGGSLGFSSQVALGHRF